VSDRTGLHRPSRSTANDWDAHRKPILAMQ
jgi:hypothetical protein